MSETDPFYSEEAEGMSKRTRLEEYFSQALEVELLLRLCPDDEDTIYQIVDAPSLSQAQRLKKLAQEGHFSYDVAFAVMGEEKKDGLDKVVIKNDTLRKYFPRSYTPKQMEDTIIKLLEQWQRKQQRQNER